MYTQKNKQQTNKQHVRTQWEGAHLKPGRSASPETNRTDTWILDYQSPELWECTFLSCNTANLRILLRQLSRPIHQPPVPFFSPVLEFPPATLHVPGTQGIFAIWFFGTCVMFCRIPKTSLWTGRGRPKKSNFGPLPQKEEKPHLESCYSVIRKPLNSLISL